MIASDKQKDDGSKANRQIVGCWGTKVDQLITDLIEVVEGGEKSIVFSQWDEMMKIVELALLNQLSYARPKTRRVFGASIDRFRCGSSGGKDSLPLLLLNVNNSGEGLTLVEATHVFMVEPIFHHGLDS